MATPHTKSYKLKVQIQSDDTLIENLDYKSNPIVTEVFHKPFEFCVRSSSERFSDGFGTMVADSPWTRQNASYELPEGVKHLDNPKAFLKRYGCFFADKPNRFYRCFSFKLNDTEVKLGNQSLNDVKLKGFLNIPQNRLYKKLTSTMTIDIATLLTLEEGFYNVEIASEQPKAAVYQTSNHAFRLDGWVVKEGVSESMPSLDSKCLNQLQSKTDVSSSTNEFIIYKLEDNDYKPIARVSPNGEEASEELKALLQSHAEFLRPYFYVPKTITVNVGEKSVELQNKDFLSDFVPNIVVPA